MLKQIFKKRINDIHEKFKKEKVLISDDMANFFGLESLGVWRIRENGDLILTEEHLIFGMCKHQRKN